MKGEKKKQKFSRIKIFLLGVGSSMSLGVGPNSARLGAAIDETGVARVGDGVEGLRCHRFVGSLQTTEIQSAK